mmetsp:Transcript_26365/g.55167  ORF Transcript_26365/g.55167 Transcript_26365/m.55167 type:complete len:240 (+) Transcript_26365:33-752(+)|eukprot:s2303_g6.t1
MAEEAGGVALHRRRRRQQEMRDAQLRREEEMKLIQEYLEYVKREKAAKQEERQLRLARLRPRPRKPCARSDVADSGMGARQASHTSMNLMTSVPSTASLRIEDRTPTPEPCEEPTVDPASPRLAEPRVRDEIPENVRKLYSKFRGPLMLKYLKELASSDQVTGWRLFEVSRSREDSTEEALSNDREKEFQRRAQQHLARRQQQRRMHQVAAEVLKGKRELSDCFKDADLPSRSRMLSGF